MLHLKGRIAAGDDLLNNDLRDMAIVSRTDGTFLYAGTGQNGGLAVYQLADSGGLASLSDAHYFKVSGMGIGSFDAISLDDNRMLILDGVGDNTLLLYRLQDNGNLSTAGQLSLPDSDDPHICSALSTVTLNNDTTALEAIQVDGQVLVLAGVLMMASACSH